MQIGHQGLEWKSTWKNDHLREIWAFANAQGGVLCIGKDDHGRLKRAVVIKRVKGL